MRRLAGLALPLLLRPDVAAAHASERMVILTLPTGRYILGAGLAVALTALLGVLAPRPRFPVRRLVTRRRWLPDGLLSWLAAIVLLALVATGFFGSRDPLENPLSLTVWTLLWVGLSFACLVFGNLWRPVNPWTGPARTLRRAFGRTGSLGLRRLGSWTAVAGYLAFAWFEIVSLAPADPAVLARAVLGYWLLILVLATLEGEDWIEEGEALSAYFALVSRIAPFWTETDTTRLSHFAGAPGAQILRLAPLDRGGAALVALVLASVSFDGLSETFWWMARIGINPLEFPGRSAVMLPNTLGLLAAWATTAALILGAVGLGRRLARRGGPFWDDAGPWLLSFLPIAAGYHAAHYLTALLTDGQYAIAALDDPFELGWSLLGLPHHWVSFGFLQDRAAVTAIWITQVGLILFAHVLAVLLGLRLTAGDRAIAHLPMTVLMVLYTVFGLWMLSAPTGA